MTSLLLRSVVDLFQLYASRPLRTDIQQDINEELPFPAVTLCNLSPFHKTRLNASDVLNAYLLKTSDIGVYWSQINFSDPNLSELLENGSPDMLQNAGFRISDLFLFCLFKGSIIQCGDYFSKRTTDYGVCFTFNSWTQTNKSRGTLRTSFTGSNRGLLVYANVNQNDYVFNGNMAAGLKVSGYIRIIN